MPKLNNRIIELLIHLAVWVYLLSTPFIFAHRNETLHWQQYVQSMVVPMMLCVVFYVNYLMFVPRYFMQHRNKSFIVSNVLLIAGCTTCIVLFMHYIAPLLHESLIQSGAFDNMPSPPKPPHGHHAGPPPGKPMKGFPFGTPKLPIEGAKIVMLTIRDAFGLICAAAVALGIRLSASWREDEKKRKEVQLQLADAALKNLKTQTSPHFLLNTLNNIYSLIAFNTDKAQEAVLDLAKMLRYQLYETELQEVPIQREAEFLDNYVKLMKLRLPETVQVNYTSRIPNGSNVLIAPHVLICLVENAFKHGISAKEKSFVEILLETTDSSIHFVCRNSYHPKHAETDKTPGGIGLQQVEQILQMTYADRYLWTYGTSPDQKSFTSELTINNESL